MFYLFIKLAIEQRYLIIYKSMKSCWIVLVLVVVSLAQDQIVIIGNKNQQKVLDTPTLLQHLRDNQNIQSLLIEYPEFQQLTETAKQVLTQLGVDSQDVSSFLVQAQKFEKQLGDLTNQFKTVNSEDLKEVLDDKQKTVIRFGRRRLLETSQVANTKSQLFNNMTPSVLSGLLVALFLIIVLLIGISCLYDIKTNDKFARSNLWVGKQS